MTNESKSSPQNSNHTVRNRILFLIAIVVIIYLIIILPLPNQEQIMNYHSPQTAYAWQINWHKTPAQPIYIRTPLRRISPNLQKAVILSEDDTFFRHNGINFALLKEAFLVNFRKKRYVRGASTITMQVARNAFLNQEKTLLRKLREIIIARRMEKCLSKNRILEIYLNIAEWGENIYGAEAASRFYFGKPASDLDLAEASLLASMLPNPKYFNPYKRLKSCKRMQKRVLWLMKLSRIITAEQMQWALQSPIYLRGAMNEDYFEDVEIDSSEEKQYLIPNIPEMESSPRISTRSFHQDSVLIQ